MSAAVEIAWDGIEGRALLIAATAKRLIEEFQDPAEYYFPGCPLSAIELAREQVDDEHGWDGRRGGPSGW